MSGERFGLTERETHLITSIWELVKMELEVNGVILFKNHFRMFPESMRFFRFKTTDVDELAKGALLKFHALRVMREISFYVDNLGDKEAVMHTLEENASNHKKRNIPASEYDNLITSTLYTFETQLGPAKFDSETKAAWDKGLHSLFKIITGLNGPDQ